MTNPLRWAALAAIAVLAAAPATAATLFPVNSGTTYDLTPANNSHTFSVGAAIADRYYYTFTTLGTFRLFANVSDNGGASLAPFSVYDGAGPGGALEFSSISGFFSTGGQKILAAGTYNLELDSPANVSDSIAGTVAVFAVPVPEPASWALMMIGVGAIGGALRRRVKTADAAA